MKKMVLSAVVGLLVLAGVALASDRWVTPAVMSFVSTADTNLVAATTWTNNGDRMVLQSVWITGATLTNGSLKLCNFTGMTNDLPLSVTGNTLYYVALESFTLEGACRLIMTGVNSSTNPASGKMAIYMIRPE